MTAEIANPEQLMRVIGVRCEQCGKVGDERNRDKWSGPFRAADLSRLVHCGCDSAADHSMCKVITCGGRILFATEPLP